MLVKSRRPTLGVPLDNGATSYHRVIQPLYYLQQQGHPVQFLASQDEQIKQYEWADVLYIQCLYAPNAYQFYADWKKKGKKIIIDFDDDYINIPENSPEQTEVIDHQTGEVYRFPSEMRSLYIQMFIQLADVVVVTTNKLKSLYSHWNKNIRVIPNCVSEEMRRDIPKSKNQKIKILWSGSTSHLPDLLLIKQPLRRIVENYSDSVELHFQSPLDEEQIKEIVPSAICHPAAAFEDYLNVIQDINPDIAVAPLQNHVFNKSKSNLKYCQMTLMEAAFVGSNIGPYIHIEHGENGFVASTEDEWYKSLAKLIEDEALRKNLVKNATEYVEKNHMLNQHIHRWAELLVF